MTVSDGIAGLSLAASVGTMLYTARTVDASRRAIQLQIFDGIFKEIKRLDREYSDFRAKGEKPTASWCDEFFNTIEYMAFLLNHKMIMAGNLHDFYKEAVLHWYKTFTENASKKNIDDAGCFPEFKKLHRQLMSE